MGTVTGTSVDCGTGGGFYTILCTSYVGQLQSELSHQINVRLTQSNSLTVCHVRCEVIFHISVVLIHFFKSLFLKINRRLDLHRIGADITAIGKLSVR